MRVRRPSGWRLVSNLPYNIATPVVCDCLIGSLRAARGDALAVGFAGLTVTVQRELADRLAARAGEEAYGPSSVIVGLLGRTRMGPTLPPAAFWPRPNVASRMMHIEPLAPPPERLPSVETLHEVLALTFGQRRKKIGSAAKRSGSTLARRPSPRRFKRLESTPTSARSKCRRKPSPSWPSAWVRGNRVGHAGLGRHSTMSYRSKVGGAMAFIALRFPAAGTDKAPVVAGALPPAGQSARRTFQKPTRTAFRKAPPTLGRYPAHRVRTRRHGSAIRQGPVFLRDDRPFVTAGGPKRYTSGSGAEPQSRAKSRLPPWRGRVYWMRAPLCFYPRSSAASSVFSDRPARRPRGRPALG